MGYTSKLFNYRTSMNRIIEFDIIRAICILEIVAYWHLRNYFPITDLGRYGSVITNVSLAGFTLISGYLNGHKKRSVLDFYSSRLKRLFIPYILSYFLLVLIGFNSFEMSKVIMDLVGLSIFAPPMPRTLWYISMLSFFIYLHLFSSQKDQL